MPASVRSAVGILFAAAALAVTRFAAGQAPADPLCLPAILARPTPPEAAEMWRRSANAPTVLLDCQDRSELPEALPC